MQVFSLQILCFYVPYKDNDYFKSTEEPDIALRLKFLKNDIPIILHLDSR